MRLAGFINETTSPTSNMAKTIVTNMFKYVLKTKKEAYIIDLFNDFLRQHNITTEVELSLKGKGVNGRCDIFNYGITLTFSPEMVEYVTEELANSNNNIKELSDVIEDLGIILSHELVHREQAKKIPLDIKNKIYNKYAASKKQLDQIEKIKMYLSNPLEIEAYAQQIVQTLEISDESEILAAYKSLFGKDGNAYKKLLKKMYFYLEKRKKGGD